ncbi:MAG: cupin domain-containing protein [Thermoleophilia bacterium]
MEIRARDAATPFVTTDGSTIRSLLDLSNAPVANQSLAEATIDAGGSTVRHWHRVAEEIYYIVEGSALMEIDGEEREVGVGDTILIPPGAWHAITASADGPVRLLCCCSPPWSAEDTLFT